MRILTHTMSMTKPAGASCVELGQGADIQPAAGER